MRRSLLASMVALAVAIPAAAGAATVPTISITSPASGSTFSRALFDTISVAGNATFDAPVAEDRTFYLRGSGCGATEEFWLSTESGDDEYDGCGIIGGLPAQEIFREPWVFPGQNGLPFLLDASKDITGTIRAEHWFQAGEPGVGQVIIDVSLTGIKTNNQSVLIGSDSIEALNTGSTGIQVPFTFDIASELDRLTLKDLSFSVLIHGVNWNSGNLGLSGDSKLTIPVFDAGRIDVSSDSASFSSTKTVQAIPNPDGTWNAEILVPSAGSRKIYARAVQAGLTTNATPVSITITA